MTASTQFRMNRPKVIHETFEDEVVIINFDSGNYYSLRQVGADIWTLIESGASVSAIVEGLAQRYEGNRAEIENAVMQFLNELQQANLVVQGTASESTQRKEMPKPRQDAGKPQFQMPVLQQYTDMQDLLLLDPIHEVDETGWPNVKVEPSNDST